MIRLRFPRMEGITPRVRQYEQLLHHSYNRIATYRNPGLRTWGSYDIYKAKRGERAPFFFMVLAQELVEKKIDPSLYLKVMSRYGQFENTKYLPPPAWLADENTIKNYEWLKAKQENQYERKADWKKMIKGFREKDVFQAIRSSTKFIQHAQSNFQLSEFQAISQMLDEMSPWFLAAYLPSATKKVSEMLLVLIKTRPDIYKTVVQCFNHFRQNEPTWRHSKQILNELLSVDEPILLVTRFPRETPKRYPREN